MLQKELLNWYGLNQRELPWRNTRDPYIIWLSEVILQQTRVQQGLPYFQKFLQKYPDVFSMASAKEDQILKLWQGLGYYSRARNMHQTAKLVVENLNGQFPSSYKELLKLKGIGPYTAAAIASFAFNEPVAVLDGNVFRVLSRLYAKDEPINSSIGKKVFEELAFQFLNKSNPASHNQAMMELGALICTPLKPLCSNCPLQNSCHANKLGLVQTLPVKLKKAKVRTRFLHYFIIENKGKIAIYQRPNGDIWHNLFDLPAIEDVSHKDLQALKNKLLELNWIQPSDEVEFLHQIKHILTHQHLEALYFLVRTKNKPFINGKEIWIEPNALKLKAIPRLFDKFLDWWKSNDLGNLTLKK